MPTEAPPNVGSDRCRTPRRSAIAVCWSALFGDAEAVSRTATSSPWLAVGEIAASRLAKTALSDASSKIGADAAASDATVNTASTRTVHGPCRNHPVTTAATNGQRTRSTSPADSPPTSCPGPPPRSTERRSQPGTHYGASHQFSGLSSAS
ncbi:hypothetical protein GCM10009558_098540 [Virgisporangium aurantiacum]